MVRFENVFKISLQEVLKMSWRHLETSSKSLEDVLKTLWRGLEDVFKTSWRGLEDVLKTYGQDKYIGLDQDVLKTSSEDEDERRLHQDECLLGGNLINIINFNNLGLFEINRFFHKKLLLFVTILINSHSLFTKITFWFPHFNILGAYFIA